VSGTTRTPAPAPEITLAPAPEPETITLFTRWIEVKRSRDPSAPLCELFTVDYLGTDIASLFGPMATRAMQA
jgi:hypothetical protein